MSMIRVLSLSLVFCLFSGGANAFYDNEVDYLLVPFDPSELPENCTFGRSKTEGEDSEVSLEEVQGAYNATVNLISYGGNTFQDNIKDAKKVYDIAEKIYFIYSSHDYIRMEGPSYVTRGEAHRFKANTLSMFANVRFYTNEQGHVGTSKSGVELNAYQNVKFEQERGVGLVWAARSDMCSAFGVWVHDAPEVEVLSLDHETRQLEIKYYVDNRYSKAVRESVDPALIIHQRRSSSSAMTHVSWLPAIGVNRKESPSNRSVKIEKGEDGRYYGIVSLWLQHSLDLEKEFSVTLQDGTYPVSIDVNPRLYQAQSNDHTSRGCTWNSYPSHGYGYLQVYTPVEKCKYRYKEVSNGRTVYRR